MASTLLVAGLASTDGGHAGTFKAQTIRDLLDHLGLQAKAEIEQFAKELEDLKFMMLARPSVENVKAYRDKEKLMWTQAMTLHEAWDMTNLLYPNQHHHHKH